MEILEASRVVEANLFDGQACGSDDVMTPVKYADYLTKHIKNARETVIPGGTHLVQMEKHKVVNEEIEQFMASLK